MKKIKLYIAMSLDGYIADEKSSVSFLGGDGSDVDNQGSYSAFIDSIDTIILGYKTYHQIITELAPDAWPYEDKCSYVLTHRDLNDSAAIHFINGNPAQLLRRLRAEAGKDIWICGGASLANQVLQEGLIDEISISVIPCILGKGIRLFDTFESEQKLTLISTSHYNGIIDIVYRQRENEYDEEAEEADAAEAAEDDDVAARAQ